MAIKTLDQAQKALEQHRVILEQIAKLEAKHNISEMRQKAGKLKEEVTAWAVTQEGLEQIELEEAHATLVRIKFDARWVATSADLREDDPEYVVPLKKLIEKKFKSKVAVKGSAARKVWMKLTKRVVDPDKIQELVNDGTLAVDDISLAFVERDKKPYLRIFEDEE